MDVALSHLGATVFRAGYKHNLNWEKIGIKKSLTSYGKKINVLSNFFGKVFNEVEEKVCHFVFTRGPQVPVLKYSEPTLRLLIDNSVATTFASCPVISVQ